MKHATEKGLEKGKKCAREGKNIGEKSVGVCVFVFFGGKRLFVCACVCVCVLLQIRKNSEREK